MPQKTESCGEPKIFFLARGCAFALGFFSLLNLIHRLWGHHLDTNLWWIDLRSFPFFAQMIVMSVSTLGLLGFAVVFPKKRGWYLVFFVGILSLLAAAVQNSIQYYLLLQRKELYQGPLFPFSICTSLFLFLISAGIFQRARLQESSRVEKNRKLKILGLGSLFLVLVCAVPVLQMYTFGKTDYRRPADAVVVLGAKIDKNGRPSLSLANRVRTACELYHQGYARVLIFSGGPNDGGTMNETESMRILALELGVLPEDILLDPEGVNTQATVVNTISMFHKYNVRRVLVVSDFSHLVRIKLLYAWVGQNVYTVPAQGYRPLTLVGYQVLRETVALWVYYLKGLLG